MKLLLIVISTSLCSISFTQSVFKNMTKTQVESIAITAILEIKKLEAEIKSIDSCKYAQEKIIYCEAMNYDTITIVKSPWDFYSFKVLSCEGNRVQQTVKLIIVVEQSSLNQKATVHLIGCRAIDRIGVVCPIKRDIFTSAGIDVVYTNIPVQMTLTIEGVMPGTDIFSLVAINMKTQSVTQKGNAELETVELRNIPIKW